MYNLADVQASMLSYILELSLQTTHIQGANGVYNVGFTNANFGFYTPFCFRPTVLDGQTNERTDGRTDGRDP